MILPGSDLLFVRRVITAIEARVCSVPAASLWNRPHTSVRSVGNYC